MTRKYTKAEAICIVVRWAQTYKQELDGKNLLFICTDKHKKTIPIELSFYGNNYLHLTGLKAPKSENGDIAVELFANDFYQKCLDHKLSQTDFDFAEDGTTHMKLDVLPTVISENLQAKMIGNYDSIKPRLYTEKVAGSTNACIGFVLDQDMQQYVPNTVVKEDIRELTAKTLRVIAVYRKDLTAPIYEELTFKAKKIDFSTIDFPERFGYLKLQTT